MASRSTLSACDTIWRPISVTALANGLKAPGRFVGMHFFNPVPLMKLVEVIRAADTAQWVVAARFATP